MGPMYYIGLDVHKQKISYCANDSSGCIHSEGWIPATCRAAMEATMFTG